MALGDSFKKALDDAEDLKGILGEIQEAMLKAAEQDFDPFEGMSGGIEASKDSLESLVGIAQRFSKSQREDLSKLSSEQLAAHIKNLQSLQEEAEERKHTLSIAQDLLKNQKDIQKAVKSANDNAIKGLKEKGSLTKEEKERLKSLINDNKSITQTIKEQEEQISQNNRILQDTDGSIKQMEEDMAKAVSTAKGMEVLKDVGKKLDKIKTPLDGILSPMKLISDLIGFIFGTIKDTDKELGETAKSMNMSYEEAGKMKLEMIEATKASGDLLLNSKNLSKSVVDLNANLGTTVSYMDMSDSLQKDVQLMSKLEGFSGLAAKETQAIMKFSMGAGVEADKMTEELMASYKVQGLNSKMVLNQKDALKAISKTSKAIQVTYNGSGKELGKALAAAKGLGVELGKVDDIAGSLLKFEQSIESELEAELLLGKDLSLEKARQAALNGDLATVAEEIAKQVGSAAEFSKMNRIQQEAMAKAVGMSREELASSLQEQEALKKMGEGSVEEAQKRFDLLVKQHGIEGAMKEMGENALTRQFEQQSTQEKAQAAQEKMADEMVQTMIPAMTELNTSFQSMFEKVKKIFDTFGGMKTVLIAIGVIMAAKLVKGTVDFAKSVGTGIDMVKKLKMAQLKETAVSIYNAAMKTFGQYPFVGFALATAAAIAAYAGVQALAADDAIFPAAGGGGYGKRTMFGPEGAIQFNNKDTIVAGTDLFADDAVSEPGKATEMEGEGKVQVRGGGDMSAVVSAIDTLGSRIDALAARPIDVGIDGTKVIEATTGDQSNVQGDEAAKNSYKVQ